MLDVIFFRTETGREPVREWLSNFDEEEGNIIDLDIRVVAEYWPQVLQTNLVKKMNKHHGSKFDTYLKEKGAFEEVKVRAQKRWEELQTEEQGSGSEITKDSPGYLARFFQWIRQTCNL